MNLLIIRHAQPHDESETGGDGDPPLSDLGLRQADLIGAYLAEEQIDHVVSSPMVRAHQTALPLCKALGLDPELDDDLKEAGWQLGAYRRGEENMHHYIEMIQRDPEYLFAPEGREAFTHRVVRAFTRIATSHPRQTVAVFCHGMVTSTIAAKALGVVPEPKDLQPTYSSLTRIRASSAGDLWTLQSFNESMHLNGLGR